MTLPTEAPEQDPRTEYRLRTVRVGVAATVLVVLGLALWPLAPDVSLAQPSWYYGLLLVALLGGLGVALLPWQALFDRGWGIPAMYGWSVADIAIITGLVAVTGGAESPIFLVYVFTTVFFAASYPLGGQIALAAFTMAAYLIVSLMIGPAALSTVAFRLLMLGLIAHMAGFLSRELLAVTEIADRRGRLLGHVAAASRDLHRLDHDLVLEQAVDTVRTLGWAAGSLELLDDADPHRSLVQHSSGLPATYRGAQPLHDGALGLVARAQAPVVIPDYGTVPGANPHVVSAGFTTGVGIPVLVRGRFAGALFAAARERREVAPVEVEALELLAATVSLALENAAAYADQQRAHERLTAVDEAKTTFILTASHELRTPMTVAYGMAQTLRQRWAELDETNRQMLLERMEAGLEQLRSLIEILVEYASASVNAGTGSAAHAAIAPAVRAAVTRAQGEHEGREVEVEVEDVDVQADETAVARVIEHLVANALAHTPPASQVRVSARPVRDTGVVRCTVSDEGPGMTREELALLEADFVRGGEADARPSGGLGLGLPLVRRLLAVYGADLHITSSPESGTTATFDLPVAAEPSDERAAPEGGPSPPLSASYEHGGSRGTGRSR